MGTIAKVLQKVAKALKKPQLVNNYDEKIVLTSSKIRLLRPAWSKESCSDLKIVDHKLAPEKVLFHEVTRHAGHMSMC